MAKHKKNANEYYVSLCYHYIRTRKSRDLFPRILGNSADDLHKHVAMMKRYYQFISLDEAYRFSYEDQNLGKKKCGMLITFDDGLSDHHTAAEVLAEHGIRAVFFIPTCIMTDILPANPTIVHYCIACYGIIKFLKAYHEALEEYRIDREEFGLELVKGRDDAAETLSKLKSIFRYKLDYRQCRAVLLSIYRRLLLRDYPDAMEIMHLTPGKVEKMIDMGHSIGAHSHSHISIAGSNLSTKDFNIEMIEPKRILEKMFNARVNAFSYPFGGKKDCLVSEKVTAKTYGYKLAFTVEKIINTRKTSPFELGRYQPRGSEDSISLQKKLEAIIKEGADR